MAEARKRATGRVCVAYKGIDKASSEREVRNMKKIEYSITIQLELKENVTEQEILDVEKLITLSGEQNILKIRVLKGSHATEIKSYTTLNRINFKE